MSKSNKERPEKPTGVEISSGNVFLEDGDYYCLSTFSFMPFSCAHEWDSWGYLLVCCDVISVRMDVLWPDQYPFIEFHKYCTH